MRKTLQVLLAGFGLTAIFVSLLHIVLGPACIPGSIPVNATMDSEDRFYATSFMAYGAALLWCVKDIEHKSIYVKLLALVFFVGGLAWIVSTPISTTGKIINPSEVGSPIPRGLDHFCSRITDRLSGPERLVEIVSTLAVA